MITTFTHFLPNFWNSIGSWIFTNFFLKNHQACTVFQLILSHFFWWFRVTDSSLAKWFTRITIFVDIFKIKIVSCNVSQTFFTTLKFSYLNPYTYSFNLYAAFALNSNFLMSSYRDSTTLMTKERLMHFLTQIFQNHFFFFFYQKFFLKLQTLKNNFFKKSRLCTCLFYS